MREKWACDYAYVADKAFRGDAVMALGGSGLYLHVKADGNRRLAADLDALMRAQGFEVVGARWTRYTARHGQWMLWLDIHDRRSIKHTRARALHASLKIALERLGVRGWARRWSDAVGESDALMPRYWVRLLWDAEPQRGGEYDDE